MAISDFGEVVLGDDVAAQLGVELRHAVRPFVEQVDEFGVDARVPVEAEVDQGLRAPQGGPESEKHGR